MFSEGGDVLLNFHKLKKKTFINTHKLIKTKYLEIGFGGTILEFVLKQKKKSILRNINEYL